MKRSDTKILDIFERHYDRAQRDPSDIEQASQTVLAQYMSRYPHLIPQFKAHVLKIFNMYCPPEEGDRSIQNHLLEAYTWNAFSNPKDALSDVIQENEDFDGYQVYTVHERMLLMGTYDLFITEYYKLIGEFNEDDSDQLLRNYEEITSIGFYFTNPQNEETLDYLEPNLIFFPLSTIQSIEIFS